jgi:hypothetical protein
MDNYKWSSHVGYISRAQKWNWLHKAFILSIISPDPDGQMKAYKRFVRLDDSEKILQVFESHRWPPLLGGKQFLGWIKEVFFEKKREKEVPESVYLAPDLSLIKTVVCAYYKIQEPTLQRSRRGISNEARDVAIYLTRLLRREGLREIGMEFGLSNYSSVSSVVDRMKSMMVNNKKIKVKVDKIKETIFKSQTKT